LLNVSCDLPKIKKEPWDSIQYQTYFVKKFLGVKRGDHPWEDAKIKWQCSPINSVLV
jgi:hypothetical protein